MAKPTESRFRKITIKRLRQLELLIDEDDACIKNIEWPRRDGGIADSMRILISTHRPTPSIQVTYELVNSGETFNYKIPLECSYPYYGGIRWWFLCPMNGCGRRVTALYLNRKFGCTKCHNIAYHSQNESPLFRRLSQGDKIYNELTRKSGDTSSYLPDRPKGMHRKTYERKIQRMMDLKGY